MANSIDWLTLPEAKRTLDISNQTTKYDDLLETAITGLSEKFDELVGPAVVRAVSNEYHDGSYANGNPKRTIVLQQGPVMSYTSVTEYQGTAPVAITRQTPGVLPDNGFVDTPSDTDPGLTEGILSRTVHGYPGYWYPGIQNISVTYTGGRFANTSSVSSQFKEAIRVALQNWFRQYSLSMAPRKNLNDPPFDTPLKPFPSFAIPNAAAQLLSKHLRPQVGFGS